MPFDISKEEQSLELENRIKYFFFEKVHAASNATNWMRITGIAVGSLSALSTCASRIAVVFEIFIKGLCNIAGSLGELEKSSFPKGLYQIFIELPLHIISGTFAILVEPFFIVEAIFGMLFIPEKYSLNKLKFFESELDRQNFLVLNEYVLKNPDAEKYFFILAECHKIGKGTAKNEKLAFEMFSKLANKNSDSNFVIQSKGMLGEMFYAGLGTSKDEQAAFTWFTKAAECNHTKSMIWLVKFFEEEGAHKDLERADHFRKKILECSNGS